MRKLLNTLYITNPNATLGRDGENIVIRIDGKEVGRRPIHILEQIVCFNYTGMNGALLKLCMKQGISVSFLTPFGEFAGSVRGPVTGNVLLRREQYRIADTMERALPVARNFISAKLTNSRKTLQRTLRDHSDVVDTVAIQCVVEKLSFSAQAVLLTDNFDSLRGLEGDGAKAYFSVFDQMILQQKEQFYVHERTRRPPRDFVNALLSFAYSLLAMECKSALETVGIDPYVGFFHTDRPGRASMALDLMEELRAYRADRFILSLINRRQITAKDFVQKEGEGVLLTDDGRRKFLEEWQKRKLETIEHPFLHETVEIGLLPYVQAMLLARFIRGDMEGYPPFFVQ